MAKIVVVDDDSASGILVEHLGFLGHELIHLSSATDALESIDRIAASDLLILDIIMAPATNLGLGINGGRAAGMAVFSALRKQNTELPVLAYTATSDQDIVDLLSNDPHTTYCSKWSTPSLSDFSSKVQHILGLAEPNLPIVPFIVHGHDEPTKLAVKNYLQNNLGLAEPIILHEQPNLGRTVIEKFEHYASKSQLAFIILTPDDKIAAVDATNDEKRRARQNVIFELGYFLATFGRFSGRVILLHKGQTELPSDINGLVYIGELIRRELQHVLR